MARVAAALALALLVQGAFAAPSCGCAGPITTLPYPLPGAYPAGVDAVALGAAYPALGAYPDALGAYPDALAGLAYAPGAYAGAYGPGLYPADAGVYEPDAVTPLSLAAPYASSTPLAPVGGPQVVGTSAGPATAYTTGPVCKTATFEVPVKSATSAVAGPVSVSSAIVDGYCSTSCPATRAKCGGTTKNVSFKTPTIINKGSKTYSSVSAIGNAVTTHSTKAGTPVVSTQVVPGPSYGPVPAPTPTPLYADAYAPGAYALGAVPFVAGLNSDDLGAVLLPAGPVAYPGAYTGAYPAPSTCACACV